jgi:hypothetical protein
MQNTLPSESFIMTYAGAVNLTLERQAQPSFSNFRHKGADGAVRIARGIFTARGALLALMSTLEAILPQTSYC